MDRPDRGNSVALCAGISARVRSLPENAWRLLDRRWGKRLRACVRPAAGLALIGLAVLLGTWARDVSGRAAILDWLARRPPTSETWNAAIRAIGFVAPTNRAMVQAALRSLPSQIDLPQTVWIAENRKWIAVFQKEDGTEPTVYVERDQGSQSARLRDPPRAWSPAGSGWEGFVKVINEFSKPASTSPRTVKRTAALWADARLLVY